LTRDPAEDIRRRLFSAGERLGWQFRDRHRFWQHWTMPRPERGLSPLLKIVLAVFGLGLVLAAFVLTLATFGDYVIARNTGQVDWMIAVWWLLLVLVAAVLFILWRGVPRATHALMVAQWERDRDAHNAAERARVDALAEWGAVRTLPGTRRIDVYGGEHEGWTAFLTTFGTSALADQTPLVVLDLSQTSVSAELCHVAQRSGVDSHLEFLPDQLEASSLLDGLDRQDILDVLVEAIHGDHSERSRDERVLDDRILRAAWEAQGQNPTLPGLLQALGDLRARGEQDAARLQRLEAYLAHLAQLPTGQPAASAQRLTCFAVTPRGSQLTTELVVDLLGQWLVRSLKNAQSGQSPRTIVVAGADHLKAKHLEQVASLCDALGFRLVLLFQHLRESGATLLGGGRATVFMRLGNYAEAELAANFIGRGYRFELARITSEHGEADTTSRTTSRGGEALHPWDRVWGSSSTRAHQTSWNYAEMRQRVYELFVEPTHLQALPPTAFILVQHVTDRQVLAIAGDSNPDLLSLPRVSTQPLPEPGQVSALPDTSTRAAAPGRLPPP
jgi:hypothetical protein